MSRSPLTNPHYRRLVIPGVMALLVLIVVVAAVLG